MSSEWEVPEELFIDEFLKREEYVEERLGLTLPQWEPYPIHEKKPVEEKRGVIIFDM